jgi:hypothetical protein
MPPLIAKSRATAALAPIQVEHDGIERRAGRNKVC